jgi:hypothetical protein
MRRMGLNSAIVPAIARLEGLWFAAQGAQPGTIARPLELRQAGTGMSAVENGSGGVGTGGRWKRTW